MSQEFHLQYLAKYISPPNPIISKKVDQSDAKIVLNPIPKTIASQQKFIDKNKQYYSQYSDEEQIQGRITLNNYYQNRTLIYRKYNNIDHKKRGKKSYCSSVFTNLEQWPSSKSLFSKDSSILRFESDKQCMNLYAVHQVSQNQYDLILNNDINTGGYTQWYYFTVFNKNRNYSVKFNIVNLYKNKSLYQSGMKPLVCIHKKNGLKQWQRGGTNVQYYQNQIKFQYGKSYYKTLSFQHTFLQDNGQTSFAHCYPHTLSDLKQNIKIWGWNSNVKVKSIGLTSLKNNLTMLEISKDENISNKRAIFIMARQHPGETIGSLICDEMISNLLKASQQNEFLLWKFTFFIIPIVNIDGVFLGNYRSNAHGFDLNRCWDRQSSQKLPEISLIKKQIKRIQKKMPIQLLLDLHGHSRKMGSFFYGNPFGKNLGIFPYIAGKQNQNVSFKDSTFHKEKSQKLTTARIVLGNIIRQTGSFYTYQTSFYGAISNGKKTHFTLDSFKQLAGNLLLAAYKTFIELHKQQKSLKESYFLKEARKQFKILTVGSDSTSSCSDSDAAQMTIKQFKAKEEQVSLMKPLMTQVITNNEQRLQPKKQISIEIQVDCNEEYPQKNKNIFGSRVLNLKQKDSPTKNNKRQNIISSSSQKYSLHAGYQRSRQLELSQYSGEPVTRKRFLLQKLRIFGQTFIEQNPNDKNKETQTEISGLYVGDSHKKQSCDESPLKISQYRKRKLRNKSLIIKLDNKDKMGMGDIVRVNRLEYKKIQREIPGTRKQQKYSVLPFLN